MKRKPAPAEKKNKTKDPKSASVKRDSKSSDEPFPVVAIGASAGGVEASSQLLKSLRPDLNMAFVFVHHLSPLYESKLPQILKRQTSMPVKVVSSGVKIERNCVYVIPSGKFMIVEDGHLQLRKRTKEDVHSIDHFMSTLAAAYQHNAIGVLLSGTDSDGTLGLKEIKLRGGITFAQDETARHPEMASNATDAGYVDYILSPQRIAEELAALIHHRSSVTSANAELGKHEGQIKKILGLVHDKYDVDFFSHYKRTTVNRRIQRRMALNNIESFEAYLKKLRSDKSELDALYNDFLINVTSFFREPGYYSSLKKDVFPQVLKNRKSTDPIRLWVPGCATGEEAYSTAITISEFLQSKKLSIPVQIFATDLDEKAINRARHGSYAKNAVSEIPAKVLEKYFTKLDGHYQIEKSIRDMCVFSVHNLMKDPPFSRMDLVSCQNVLIYIEAAPQRKILQSFHYALNPSGFLLLGKSETIGNSTDLFQSLDTETKLYKKKQHSKQPLLDFTMRSTPNVTVGKAMPEQRTLADVETEFDKLLLTRYVPASVLVNKDLDILRFRGSTSSFFQPASGKASLNLLKMVKDELTFEMRVLFQKAKKSNTAVSKGGILIDSTRETVAIEIAPIKSGKDFFYLIVFQVQSSTEMPVAVPKLKKGDHVARIQRLEQALKDARDHLRTTTEDFDVAREELQSANEEILSSNEELQSINEELETSKEELQSANEELTTINEELQNRIGELKQSHDYIQAIIETMHGPLLVVSSQMRIRTANNAFYQFFKLKPEHTEGKFLDEIAQGRWDIPSLRNQVRDLFPNKLAFKNFEISHEFPGIGMRTMYVNAHLLTNPGSENQILLAFNDITEFRSNEAQLREAQQQLRLALEGGSVGTWAWSIKTNAIAGSKEEAILFGLEDGKFFKTFSEWAASVHPDDLEFITAAVKTSVEKRKPLDAEFRIIHKNGRVRWLLSKANTYYDATGEPERVMGVNIDVTERKQAIEALAESERRFHTLSDQAPVMIWMDDDKQRCNFLNKTWLEFTGRSLEQERDNGWYEGLHPEDKETFLATYNEAYQARREFKADYRLRRHDGEYRWILAHGVPRYTNNDTFIGYIGTCIDISERIELEKQKDDFMGIASHELKTPVTSIKAYTQILHERFKKTDDTSTTTMLGRLDNQIDKLTDLINTLLDVARIQNGHMEYDSEYFQILPFIGEALEDIRNANPQRKIELEFHVDQKQVVFADRTRVVQVLNNLVSNAIKYSPASKSIIVRVSKKDNVIIFEVQDFGPGIEPNLHNKIFERFYRVNENNSTRVSGLGLGLYISSQIVRQQGGDISLKSEVGRGSRFLFSLPADKIDILENK